MTAGAINRVIDIECRASETVTDGMRVSGELKKAMAMPVNCS